MIDVASLCVNPINKSVDTSSTPHHCGDQATGENEKNQRNLHAEAGPSTSTMRSPLRPCTHVIRDNQFVSQQHLELHCTNSKNMFEGDILYIYNLDTNLYLITSFRKFCLSSYLL